MTDTLIRYALYKGADILKMSPDFEEIKKEYYNQPVFVRSFLAVGVKENGCWIRKSLEELDLEIPTNPRYDLPPIERPDNWEDHQEEWCMCCGDVITGKHIYAEVHDDNGYNLMIAQFRTPNICWSCFNNGKIELNGKSYQLADFLESR